jgi:hypothetical protein
VKKSWVQRTAEVHGEIAAIADRDPRWWLLAGGVAAAEPWGEHAEYVRSDAEPGEDTFLGLRTPTPSDPIADAIARARAARIALREFDGTLPDQPLAVTVHRQSTSANGNGNGNANGNGNDKHSGVLVPSGLDAAALAIGD